MNKGETDLDDLFHYFDCPLDDGEDNRPTPVTSSTRTAAAAAAAAAAATMPGGSGGSGKTRKLKLISRPNRNDVLCGRG